MTKMEKLKNTNRVYFFNATMIIIILIILSPSILFVFVKNASTTLENYIDFINYIPKEDLKVFSSLNIPNHFEIFGTGYIGLGITIFGVIWVIFWNYMNKYKINNFIASKTTIIGVTAILFSLSVVFSAISIFNYDIVISWADSLRGQKGNWKENLLDLIPEGMNNREDIIYKLSNIVTGQGTNNPNPMKWIGVGEIGFFATLQIGFIIFVITRTNLKIQRYFDAINENSDFILNTKRKVKRQRVYTKSEKFIAFFEKSHNFQISKLALLIGGFVVLPQIFYLIVITYFNYADGGTFFDNLILRINLVKQNLFNSDSGIYDPLNMLYYNKLASIRFIDYFTITILPFIGLAFIFAQLLVFSRIVINKEQISVKNFKRLYIIAVVVLALSLSLFFISQFNLYRINNIWNRQTEFFRNNIIKKLFGQSAIAPLWISEIKAIAVLIISFLSIGTFGAMGLSKILKEEFKEINQKYTYQINQKVIGWLED